MNADIDRLLLKTSRELQLLRQRRRFSGASSEALKQLEEVLANLHAVLQSETDRRNPVEATIGRIRCTIRHPLQIYLHAREYPRMWVIERRDDPRDFKAYLAVHEDGEGPGFFSVTPIAESGDDEQGVSYRDRFGRGPTTAETISLIAESFLTADPAEGPEQWIEAGKQRFDAVRDAMRGNLASIAENLKSKYPELNIDIHPDKPDNIFISNRIHEQDGYGTRYALVLYFVDAGRKLWIDTCTVDVSGKPDHSGIISRASILLGDANYDLVLEAKVREAIREQFHVRSPPPADYGPAGD